MLRWSAPALVAVLLLSGSLPAAAESNDDVPLRFSLVAGEDNVPPGCKTFRYLPHDGPTNPCHAIATSMNGLDSPRVDVLILVPAGPFAERDLRIMRQSVQMWEDGLKWMAADMDLDWLAEGIEFRISTQVIDDPGTFTEYKVLDPEIVVVASNPVGGLGIGVDPLDFSGQFLEIFGVGGVGEGPCHGEPNPLAGLDVWRSLPGFDSHHDDSGTYSTDCDGGGAICYAVNGAIDPVPGQVDFFGLFDLVAHEFGHCLTVGHVGDALDHEANASPYADIMSYTNQPHDKCVSTLDVEAFALTMSRFFLDRPLGANDGLNENGPFQVQHPGDHRYASPTGAAEDCPQPDADLVPGGNPGVVPSQDDAGSGRDAPDGTAQAVAIAPDVAFEGTTFGPILDSNDVYRFTAEAGQTFRGLADGFMGCYYLLDGAGVAFEDYACSYGYALNTGPLVIELPETGDHYLRLTFLAPAVYRFGFSLTGEPPEVRILP